MAFGRDCTDCVGLVQMPEKKRNANMYTKQSDINRWDFWANRVSYRRIAASFF